MSDVNLRQRIGRTKTWSRVMRPIAPHIDRVASRLSGGRINVASAFIPTLILVHRGAKTGRERRSPLSYVAVGDRFGLAGSNWGQAHHPAWTANLIANPDVSVVVKGKTIQVRARRLSDAEKAELWPRFVEMWPAYGEYEVRSGDRNIRLFLLEPRA
jgi:deazaflavin-dependent oxidoreductase (nitroreductase family)